MNGLEHEVQQTVWSALSVGKLEDRKRSGPLLEELLKSASPWRTVGSIPIQSAQLVMNVLQEELDLPSTVDGYRSSCIKCLSALGKKRNIVPDSFFCHDIQREGAHAVSGGGFADIWKGIRAHDRKVVCLKVLRIFEFAEARDTIIAEYCHEALLWRQLRHPNVLPFLGVRDDLFSPSFCLISPWMINGNIMEFLRKHPEHDRFQSIAEAIDYLHTLDPQIVHADVRGGNILVADDFRCLLADFGISHTVGTQAPGSSARHQGTIRWMPPEMLDDDLFDPRYFSARDIYSFGCTIIEIYTGKPPFSDIRTDAGVINIVVNHRRTPPRPAVSAFPSDALWYVVMACLSWRARDRPIAAMLLQSLQQLLDPFFPINYQQHSPNLSTPFTSLALTPLMSFSSPPESSVSSPLQPGSEEFTKQYVIDSLHEDDEWQDDSVTVRAPVMPDHMHSYATSPEIINNQVGLNPYAKTFSPSWEAKQPGLNPDAKVFSPRGFYANLNTVPALPDESILQHSFRRR
ncbi:kinase-like protein [Hymenopellis radicata]|nr:kinase-like protein [Hymenopellis radicata]